MGSMLMCSKAAFTRDARLLGAAQFKQVFDARQRFGGRFFVLHWRFNDDSGPRLGLAVSRKVDTRAVVRNRLKRLWREAFRQQRPHLPSLDLVVLAKREAVAAEPAALQTELTWLWRKLCALPAFVSQGTMPAAPPAAEAPPVTSVD